MGAVWAALLWGSLSAASFPAGALVGLYVAISTRTTGLMIAFGAGALIFAVTVELFGELMDRVEEDAANLGDVAIEFIAVVCARSTL
jgi:zinc transporter ZupT